MGDTNARCPRCLFPKRFRAPSVNAASTAKVSSWWRSTDANTRYTARFHWSTTYRPRFSLVRTFFPVETWKQLLILSFFF